MATLGLDELLELQGHSVVLMPNDASARQCRDAIASRRGGHDQAFLETITVVPVEQWLAELWDSSFPKVQVLRPIQLLALARNIIESSAHYPSNCLNPLAITRQFVDAFNLHADYQLGNAREAYLFSPEYQAFADWRVALQTKLDQLHAMSSAQLPEHLLDLLHQGELALPDTLVLSDVLTLNPAISAFIDACAQHSQRRVLILPQQSPRPTLISGLQCHQECAVVADDIATHLKDHPERNNIAVVLPEMDAYQAPLNAALCRQLYPAALFPRSHTTPLEPWVFEGSEKLLSFPLISAAWDLISLSQRPLPLEQLSRLLRSRFVNGWPDHRSERARLDLLWREQLAPQATLDRALAISKRRESDCPGLLHFLNSIKSLLDALPGRQLPSLWVRHFDQLLLHAGWPNAEDDDLVVAQCRRGFSQAMDVFRALDRQLGPIGHSDALSWLQHILATKRFSIVRDWHSPIRIMGYEDAAGQQFDALWIMGLDDSALPRRPEPSPFLPLQLQQAAHIPNSEPGLLLRRDRRLLDSLLTCANRVTISYSTEDGNGSPRALCSLLKHFATTPVLQRPPAYQCSAELIQPQQDAVAAISSAELTELRGGTGLFKEYAASPFFAFLRYRLQLREFPNSEEGLDHRIQGILLHDTLQHFWGKIRRKSTLSALSDEQLNNEVSSAVSLAMQNPEIRPGRYGDALLLLERQRLITLVTHWLQEKELARLDDFDVVGMEQGREVKLKGIPLKLRIDRIDHVDGHRLLIDYKSGSISGTSLNSDDMSEPQLPIYAVAELAAGEGVDGVMLASIKSVDDMSIHLRSNWRNSVIKKRSSQGDVDTPEKWQDQLSAWDTALQEMAEGILSGDIAHNFGRDHSRSFSAYLLTLLRGEQGDGEEGE